jgi:predicted nucleic acid-binding Zn ribbon protein
MHKIGHRYEIPTRVQVIDKRQLQLVEPAKHSITTIPDSSKMCAALLNEIVLYFQDRKLNFRRLTFLLMVQRLHTNTEPFFLRICDLNYVYVDTLKLDKLDMHVYCT